MEAIDRRHVVVDFNVAVACVNSECRGYTGKVEDGNVRSEAWVAILQSMNDE